MPRLLCGLRRLRPSKNGKNYAFLFRVLVEGWTPNASLTPLPRSTAFDKASNRKGPNIK